MRMARMAHADRADKMHKVGGAAGECLTHPVCGQEANAAHLNKEQSESSFSPICEKERSSAGYQCREWAAEDKLKTKSEKRIQNSVVRIQNVESLSIFAALRRDKKANPTKLDSRLRGNDKS